MLGNLGFGELMVIMVIVLVLFGAKRVPEISASFGKGIREFKRNLNEIEHTVTSAATTPELGADRSARLSTPVASYEPSPEERAAEEIQREPKRLL